MIWHEKMLLGGALEYLPFLAETCIDNDILHEVLIHFSSLGLVMGQNCFNICIYML